MTDTKLTQTSLPTRYTVEDRATGQAIGTVERHTYYGVPRWHARYGDPASRRTQSVLPSAADRGLWGTRRSAVAVIAIMHQES